MGGNQQEDSRAMREGKRGQHTSPSPPTLPRRGQGEGQGKGGLPGGGVLSLMSRLWTRERQGGSSQESRPHTRRGSLLYLHQDIGNVATKHAELLPM